MGKAIKTFLILNLILSLVVAYFGFILFKDREIVKARTLLLQDSAQKIAENLSWGQEVEWETAEERKTAAFSVPQPATPEELPSLDGTLTELSRFATQRLAQLNQRFTELVQTQRELADTRETLATRERELAQTRQELTQARQRIVAMEEDLRQSRLQVNTLTVEKEGLERQVEGLNAQLLERDEKIAILEVDIAKLQEDLANLTQRDQARTPNSTTVEAWKGRTASLLAVNEPYRFVIIDKGEIDVLPTGIEAIVHRGEEFIGTVIVRQVEDLVAIAEINEATLIEGKTLQPGDTVFF